MAAGTPSQNSGSRRSITEEDQMGKAIKVAAVILAAAAVVAVATGTASARVQDDGLRVISTR